MSFWRTDHIVLNNSILNDIIVDSTIFSQTGFYSGFWKLRCHGIKKLRTSQYQIKKIVKKLSHVFSSMHQKIIDLISVKLMKKISNKYKIISSKTG